MDKGYGILDIDVCGKGQVEGGKSVKVIRFESVKVMARFRLKRRGVED